MLAAVESRLNGWNDAAANFYAETIAQSSYAKNVAPLLGAALCDVLDIGAGSGELTRRALAFGAHWAAVEPNAAMQERLSAMRNQLQLQRIRLTVHTDSWQSLASGVSAKTVLAANLGATHQDAAVFFDAMRPRATEHMLWVVPAQAGPSTFCLAGFLPLYLHGADTQPAVDRCIADLGSERAPDSVSFADWRYQVSFASTHAAQAHFLDRLGLDRASSRGQEVADFVAHNLRRKSAGLVASCQKRSAVLRWQFHAP